MISRKFLFAIVCCFVQASHSLFAQDADIADKLQKMQDLLDQQQKQLDDQSKELAAQRLLIKQLQGDSTQEAQASSDTPDVIYPDSDATTPSTVQQSDPDAPVPDADQSGQQQAVLALAKQQVTETPEDTEEQKKQSKEDIADKAFYDPSNTAYDPNFPGAWYLPGTTAAMKVGGYVNLSLVNSFDPMTQPDRFIVGSIPPDGETVPGAVEGIEVSARQSRVNVEYREQTNLGEIRAFVEGDFQNSNDGFRLRHAFGQFRSILAGYTWTTFMDSGAQPEEVDVEGINGQVLLRHAQIRWTPRFGEKYQLKIALEDPQTDVLNGESQRGAFDLVANVDWMPLGLLGKWNYRIGFILRDLKAIQPDMDDSDSILGSDPEGTTGWGITTSGRHPVDWWGGQDYFLWQATYGEGIGHYLTDLRSVGGGDAVFDPRGQLRALPVFAGYVSYMHRWPLTRKWFKDLPGVMRSSVTVSWVNINNYEFQDGGDYSRTLRGSVNLLYSPTENMQTGVEFLWGRRENKNGSKGTATQLQFAVRYIF
jgi:hypothetical protein